jgi:radical SAM family uncharacterized protein/radical SAM-linked protein
MESELKAKGIKLFSLEFQTPLKEFDLIGFTLQYELCATNILNMLDLAGLPVFAADRTDTSPIIIAGGPMTANPEPLADFFDAFVLGDGEEVINEIIDILQKCKKDGLAKDKILKALAGINGIYVPSLYYVEYSDDGCVKSVKPTSSAAPSKIHKRTIKLDEIFFPSAQIVPFAQTAHNRLNIEIARGCPRRCRFCQANRYYSPWRERSVENILKLVDDGLAKTGYDQLSLSSLSCTEYNKLDILLDEIIKRHSHDKLSVSLPSLRCDQFSIATAAKVSHNKKSGLTFAPEAGTDRLRDVIAKDLAEQEIIDTIVLAWQKGWKLVKLYFMVGLPGESEADIKGIVDLVRLIKQKTPGLNFNITLSPFVPKTQTPFQWYEMADKQVIKDRLSYLRKNLPASVKSHDVNGSVLEAVIARGDRRVSKAIYLAWQKGCRFDQWKEYVRHDLWQQAFDEAGINLDFYVYRKRSQTETFAWDHLVFGTEKEKFLKDYNDSMRIAGDSDDAVSYTSLKSFNCATPLASTFSEVSVDKSAVDCSVPAVERARLRFERKGIVRLISHLEQVEIFRRALRRAKLPMTYTEGFHPQPRVSFGPAISVGYESMSEYIDVELSSSMTIDEIKNIVNKSLPSGFKLLTVKKIPLFFPSLDALINIVEYDVLHAVSQQIVDKFLSQEKIMIEKTKKNGKTIMDIKPLIKDIKLLDSSTIKIQLRVGPNNNIKPEKVVQAMCGLNDVETKQLNINRVKLCIEKQNGSISEP